ncbi:uncharacterized protein LOC120653510 [Panicum virgatum]|uniref:uncharacterized protein LOC120653510 n=1 Tax=Panicum virgatum TaxID=38727 RepID=UPI0019D58EA2|nr:uncharacterized protein LOC120653510 [Panicum virgatum]
MQRRSQLLSSVPFTVHTRDSPKCIFLLDSVLSSPVLVFPSSSSLPRSLCIGADRDSGGGQQHRDGNSSSPDAGSNSSAATAGVGSVGSKLDSSIVPAQRRRRRRLNDRLYAFRIIVPNMGRHRIHLASTQVHPTHAAARVLATHRDSRPAAWGDSAGGLLVALVEQEVKLVILNLWEALEHSSRKSQRGRACHPRRARAATGGSARRPAGRLFYFLFGL